MWTTIEIVQTLLTALQTMIGDSVGDKKKMGASKNAGGQMMVNGK